MPDRLTNLWLDARDGDRRAFAEAVRAAQGDVWRFARHLVGVRLADEVAQDTFVRAWRSLPQFRADSTARTWLLAIARRAAADAVRSEQRVRRNRAALPISTDRVDDYSEPLGLESLIDNLGTDQREAFILTQFIGLSYEEAAMVCRTKVGTIRSRVARAREQLIGEVGRASEA